MKNQIENEQNQPYWPLQDDRFGQAIEKLETAITWIQDRHHYPDAIGHAWSIAKGAIELLQAIDGIADLCPDCHKEIQAGTSYYAIPRTARVYVCESCSLKLGIGHWWHPPTHYIAGHPVFYDQSALQAGSLKPIKALN